MEKTLEVLMNKLYDTEGNQLIYTRELIEEMKNNEKDFNFIINTPSIHNNYIDTSSYGMIKLLPKGRYYIEEKRKVWYKKIVPHFHNLSGFYTVLVSFFALICSIIAIIISLKS